MANLKMSCRYRCRWIVPQCEAASALLMVMLVFQTFARALNLTLVDQRYLDLTSINSHWCFLWLIIIRNSFSIFTKLWNLAPNGLRRVSKGKTSDNSLDMRLVKSSSKINLQRSLLTILQVQELTCWYLEKISSN